MASFTPPTGAFPKLFDDDVDGGGYSLKNIKDVACKTVNGEDVNRRITEGFARLTQDFTQLAPKEHTHTLALLDGLLPTGKLEKGVELDALLKRNLSDESHTHPDLKRAVQRVAGTVEKLKEALSQLVSREALDELVFAIAELEDRLLTALDDRLLNLKESLPKPYTPQYELCLCRYALVPHALDGKEITALEAVDFEGNVVPAGVTRKGTLLAVGDVLFAKDFLTAPPCTLVSLRFA